MTILKVTVKKKEAIKTLEKLRENDLIDFKSSSISPKKMSKKEKTQTHFASEKVLARDWLTKKEDAAWQNL